MNSVKKRSTMTKTTTRNACQNLKMPDLAAEDRADPAGPSCDERAFIVILEILNTIKLNLPCLYSLQIIINSQMPNNLLI